MRRASRVVGTCLATVFVSAPLVAQETTPPLAQWHHTAWTARDGLNGRPQTLAQTADGFLWIGTTEGLFRYDGAQFERVRPSDGDFPRVSVTALAAVPDGGLWIGYEQGGASLLDAHGRATHYHDDQGVPFGAVRSFARTDDGAVWLSAVGGFARFADGRWQRVRKDWGYTCLSASALFVDRTGGLWVGGATPDRLMYLRKGSRRFELAVEGLAARRVAQASDGTLLVVDGAAGLHPPPPATSERRVRRGGRGRFSRVGAGRRPRRQRVGAGIRSLATEAGRRRISGWLESGCGERRPLLAS